MEFDALMRQMNTLCEQGITLGSRVERKVAEWLAVDGQGVSRLLDFSRSHPLPDIRGILTGGGVILAGAQVMGASTSIVNEQYALEYQQMSWGNKIKAEQDLKVQIDAQQKALAGMKSEDELQGDINSIDQQIAELEKQKAEAQKQADIWYNKVIPDTPLAGDNDGVP
jgi:hypothetical protein